MKSVVSSTCFLVHQNIMKIQGTVCKFTSKIFSLFNVMFVKLSRLYSTNWHKHPKTNTNMRFRNHQKNCRVFSYLLLRAAAFSSKMFDNYYLFFNLFFSDYLKNILDHFFSGIFLGIFLLVTGGMWQVAGDRWQVAGGRWQVAGGKVRLPRFWLPAFDN